MNTDAYAYAMISAVFGWTLYQISTSSFHTRSSAPFPSVDITKRDGLVMGDYKLSAQKYLVNTWGSDSLFYTTITHVSPSRCVHQSSPNIIPRTLLGRTSNSLNHRPTHPI